MNNIGNNHGGGGFRGFASKLREQAKDAVQVAGNLNNYKLPSFDDMAQNDRYIHSPDFNVRGSASGANAAGGTASATEATKMAANHGVETATADDVASYYSHSTGSSWSLLDRTGSSLLDRSNINNINNNNINNNNNNKSDANEIVSTTVQPTKQGESESDPAKIARTQQTAKTSSVSLLSVVTDTLQQQQQSTRPGIGAGSTNYDTSSINTMSNSNDNGSDDDSSEDFDEEDPILSMMRNKDKRVAGGSNDNGSSNSDDSGNGNGNGNDAPTSVITIRNPKPSNRFMEDVRLQTPLNQPQQTIDEMLANSALQEQSRREPEDPNTGDDRISGPFGGYFKNMALESLDRFKRGLNGKQQQQQQQQLRTPPLSRGRKKMQQPTLSREDEESDYEITTSAGMLGEDDLEHLKQLQLGSASAGPSKLAMMLRAGFWNEHKRFLFIAFTLGLAIYVYFFANTVEDDLT